MLRSKPVLTAVFFCLILAMSVVFMTEDVYAKDDSATSADKDLATKEGLGNKDWDETQLPGKFEIGLAIGSIVALIGVMKFV
jgi:hypothetical protein